MAEPTKDKIEPRAELEPRGPADTYFDQKVPAAKSHCGPSDPMRPYQVGYATPF
jgi:hypothetical protein